MHVLFFGLKRNIPLSFLLMSIICNDVDLQTYIKIQNISIYIVYTL